MSSNAYQPDDFDGRTIDGEVVDAEVVDLDKVRNRRTAAERGTSTGPAADDADADADADADEDAESLDDDAPTLGAPVDRDDDPGFAPARRQDRRPILPRWAYTMRGIKAAIRWQLKDLGYVSAFHAVRLPKYAGKLLVWCPVGLFTGTGRLLLWASAEEGNYGLRQAAAGRGSSSDIDQWLKLDARRQRQSTWRWWLLAAGAGAVTAGGLILAYGPVPEWAPWAALAGTVGLLARVGRPDDKPITDRVTEATRYRKLTAELVRRGLTSLGLSGINSAVAKDPRAISFPVDIHRDGPGHIAIVDLPYGVEASEVVARRGKLASALRLPLDQVWPEPAEGHTGRLALWVGYEPASQMKQPAWPLIRDGKVDVFAPFPFSTTPRMEFIDVDLMFRNWLFGGQPGSGKTFALRLLVLAAALDPRVELRGYELKGVGDFKVLEPLLTEYGNGFDDDTIARAAGMIDWLYEECERRSKKIAHYANLGKAPENKVTPELASLKGSGLHPLVAFIDEIQELFTHPKYGKAAGEKLEKVIKLGRALGVILLIGTQIPDKDSLPTGITRNVNTRFCLSVADQTANDMILGTSMYKRGFRATVFRPVVEAGWGILAGFDKPSARRSFYVDTVAAARIVERALALRTKAGTLPEPDSQTRDAAHVADVLADLAQVWPAGQDKVWNDTLCASLAELRPDVYGGWESAQLTAALKPHPVKVTDVGRRIDGKPVTRRGIAHTDILAAIAERNRKRSAG
ncbi:FtsK/SpoIIIE domain-containing protein [Polymorphospora rubra]|uniref:FtsK/SpoIIIE domain-containing protein n=1 Tax=Polymorphospora rubra TaxID=338584 RepID=UPI0033E51C22